jgi:hypothetical protein
LKFNCTDFGTKPASIFVVRVLPPLPIPQNIPLLTHYHHLTSRRANYYSNNIELTSDELSEDFYICGGSLIDT